MEERKDKQDAQRILLIKETIINAEKNLQTAKSLLAQLESKYIPQKKTYGVAEGGKVIEGSFDGQLMIGTDGRQYPVPANYASKSKLVEGDMLKLVITDDGNFIYKQIGPFKRKRALGTLRESPEEGGYVVEAEGKTYKVLLAAVTYHHASVGDEIALVVADNDEAKWAAIENVTKKGAGGDGIYQPMVGDNQGFTTSRDVLGDDDAAEKEETEELDSSLEQLAESKKAEKKKKGGKKKGDEEKGFGEDQLEEEKNADAGEKNSAEENSGEENSASIDEELTPDLMEMEEELKKQIPTKE